MPKQPQAQPNWFQKFMDLGLDTQYTPQPKWYTGASQSMAQTGQIPKPKGDAVKRIRENTFKDSQSTSTTTDVETQQKTKEMISPKTLETLVETLNEFPLTSSKELVSGLEEYQKIKDEIAKAKANTQVNLMPLMALSDMWYGGNLAKTYTPPTSKDDYLKMQAELEGATQQARVGLSKEDIDLANTLLSNFYIAGTDTKEIDKKDEVKGVGNTIINIPPALQPREPAPKAPPKPPAKKKYSQEETKNAKFARAMENAEEIISKLEKQGYDRSDLKQEVQARLPNLANKWKSPTLREWSQAEVAFGNAALRDETGSSINTDERNLKIEEMFPRPGDNATTRANKKRARLQAIESMKVLSSGAYDEIRAIPVEGTSGVSQEDVSSKAAAIKKKRMEGKK